MRVTGTAKKRRRPRREGPVAVEQHRAVQPRAGRDLGDGVLGRGALDAAGAAAVDELQRRDRRDRGDDLGPAVRPARGPTARCIRRTASPRSGRPGGRVLHAGDLRLVGHQPDQREARAGRPPARASAAASSAGCARGSGGRRRAPGRRRPAARRRRRGRPAAPAGAPGGTTAVDEVELVDRVDHQRHPGGRRLVGGQPAQRRPVGRRVADDDVGADRVVAAGQPQRLGAGSRRARRRTPAGPAPGAAPPRLRTDLLATRIGLPAARRTRSSALASRASRSSDGERRVEVGGGVVQPGPCCAARGGRAGGLIAAQRAGRRDARSTRPGR